jgi:hypothetical protein
VGVDASLDRCIIESAARGVRARERRG